MEYTPISPHIHSGHPHGYHNPCLVSHIYYMTPEYQPDICPDSPGIFWGITVFLTRVHWGSGSGGHICWSLHFLWPVALYFRSIAFEMHSLKIIQFWTILIFWTPVWVTEHTYEVIEHVSDTHPTYIWSFVTQSLLPDKDSWLEPYATLCWDLVILRYFVLNSQSPKIPQNMKCAIVWGEFKSIYRFWIAVLVPEIFTVLSQNS